MLNTKSFLTVDFGAGSLKLAEFEINEAGGLRLDNFASNRSVWKARRKPRGKN
jgi:hypothetical protein